MAIGDVVKSVLLELPSSAHAPTRLIHTRSAGSRSTPQQPVVVFICGLGASCLTFTTVQQHLAAAGTASFTYDRCGIGRSSPLPQPDLMNGEASKPKRRLAQELASELEEVLHGAGLSPPYILAAHSYGGVIAWEYIAQHAENVVGFLTIDANSARSSERPILDPDLEVLTEGLPEGAFDYFEIVGLHAANRLRPELWHEAIERRNPPEGWPHSTGGEAAEMEGYFDSCRALRDHDLINKHPLGRYPVTVIQGDTENDLRRMIRASEELGGGTKEAHSDLRKRLEGLSLLEADQQRDHLLLTSTGMKKFVETKNSGHWVHITEPEIVDTELSSMVEHLRAAAVI